jgi:exodeoxyribonuclease-5
LTAEQEIAVDTAVTAAQTAKRTGISQFLSIQGAAGTGKTTTTRAVQDALKALGFTVGAAAMTHKAAGVLGAAVGHDAITLASLLGLREQVEEGEIEFVPLGPPRLKEADVWLIDEVSMLHPKQLELLEEAARNGAKAGYVHTFVLIGDPSQLQPVNHDGPSPALFQSITAQLTKVHRHAGPVLRLATEIRCGEDLRPALTETIVGGDSSVVVHADHSSWWRAFIAACAEAKHPDDVRLIAFTNNAVSRYNAKARAHFLGVDAPPFVSGELVVTHGGSYLRESVERNPYRPELLYGTSRELRIGEVKQLLLQLEGSAACGDVREYVDQDGKADETRFARKYEFNAWEITTAAGGHTLYALDPSHRHWHEQMLAWLRSQKYWYDYWLLKRTFVTLQPHWALTIHKSQGSQFRQVFVDLANIEGSSRASENFKRALLYTGVTRAQRAVHVIADRPAANWGEWL